MKAISGRWVTLLLGAILVASVGLAPAQGGGKKAPKSEETKPAAQGQAKKEEKAPKSEKAPKDEKSQKEEKASKEAPVEKSNQGAQVVAPGKVKKGELEAPAEPTKPGAQVTLPAKGNGEEQLRIPGEKKPLTIIKAPRPEVVGLEVEDDDTPTTKLVAKDIPEIENLHKLMERLNSAHKKARDKSPAVAARAAKEVESLALAAMHPRLTVKEEEFQNYLLGLHAANQKLQKALESPQDKMAIARALRAQGNACSACHRKYHPEEE